ncbi:CBS domain-containing protein [Kitasatospora sp. DSM 101779]|uniref:CBS domain-containing protein n=1 Tax=Kitasatospora sp. DSM 101779 TaxID=2853165 RepID=UPI0021DA44E7|nr:CBS domain-containing protein [Kitasatospora sp. DSM 101779]MCU7826422.1 CBS domain-containing protein [Kitasatospora sp. DSM 101779]
MRHRLVGELMTSAVVHVRPETGFKDIVRLLAEHDITSVPVLDQEDRPVGLVSEADLLLNEAAQEDPSGLMLTPRLESRERTRSRATTAAGLMTSPVVCARPEWTVVEAARLMQGKRLKRLPVVDEAGRLVGIVSRSDLLRVFLRQDRAIREEIRRDVLRSTLDIDPDTLDVRVHDGFVTLAGTVDHPGQVPVVERLCRSVDGVVGVTGRLDHRRAGTAVLDQTR